MAIKLEASDPRRRTAHITIAIFGLFCLLLTALLTPSFWSWSTPEPDFCKARYLRAHFETDPSRINERSSLFPDLRDVLLTNATLIDGDGALHANTNILVHKSTIVEVSTEEITLIEGREQMTDVVDLQGKYVTPGLVDMHSHFGTRVQPQLKATEDTNEYTSPITPFVRAIDGIDSQDPELDSLAASGVTTHLVLTGSKNLLSGESYAVKMLKSPHNLVDELLVQWGVKSQKLVRWFKMAYGENEKQTGLPGYPVSRIGAIWRIREAFTSAKQLMTKQDTWCSSSRNWNNPDSFPTDIHLQTMVDILRGDLNIHVHLYEAYDFESIIRVADEFNFHVAGFHHALSAYKVPELLKSHNTTVAIFADVWGGKKEQYDGTVHAPKMLEDQGVPVALKTDHPALPGQQLLYYAQIAHHFGLKAALQSVTSIPAASMGMDHRIGYIRQGYDADLVVWDRHPLTLGALTLETLVDGVSLFEFDKVNVATKEDQNKPLMRQAKAPETCKDLKGKKNLIVRGIVKSLVPDFVMTASEGHDLTAVISNGEVVCVGDYRSCVKAGLDYDTLEVSDGYLVPGVTSISEGLGLREMELEASTSDGSVTDSTDFDFVSAADGLKLDGIMIERLDRTGITQGVTAPIGTAFKKGYSTHFRLSSPYDLSSSILKSKVAVHFSIGNDAKSNIHSTISSQISALREYLSTRADAETYPVAVHTHNSAIISQIIRLSHEFPEDSFIIIGGQEAHLVADALATAYNVSLVLSPWRCTAKFWDNRHCSNGWPLERPSVDILHDAGVPFVIAYDETANLRRLFWEAGEAGKAAGMTLEQTAGLVSVDKVFGIKNEDMLVFEHNPFEFGATLALSVEDREVNRCFPDPEEAKHGDMLF